MANVLLTETCVRSCPYCFAKKHMEDQEEGILKWQDLIYIADFLESSNEKHISLLGGEPSLHPHFVDFIIYLLERDFHVNIFTSGIFPENTLADADRHLSGVHPERLSFVCNVNDPKKSNFSEVENVKRFLKIFGHLTSPGFNIYKPEFDMTFIFQLINQFGLKKHLRLGLAHPIPGQKNIYVKREKLTKMIDSLLSYEPYFKRFRVNVGFDCGFPLCSFTDDQLGKLFKISGGRMSFGCGPAVDIGPDMNIWSCFPLSDYHKKSIYDFDNIKEVVDYYMDFQYKVRGEAAGIFKECDDCFYREDGLCSGGCLAHMLSDFKFEEPIRMGEVYP